MNVELLPPNFVLLASTDNPADVGSRGCLPQDLLNNALWWHGPPWIRFPVDWPNWIPPSNTEIEPEATEQIKADTTEHDTATFHSDAQRIAPQLPINIPRFSSWRSLLRVFAHVLRAIDRWQKRPEKSLVEYCRSARILLLRHAQSELPSSKSAFPLSTDTDGLLRITDRLVHASPRVAPILLPRDHPLTELLVREAHDRTFHGPPSLTLSKFRERYWTPRARRLVQRLIRQCSGCKRWTSKPFILPPFPPHPAERVCRSRPFQHVGVDYFGPLLIKTSNTKQKRWIALFTCFTTRAIHLEVADSLTAFSCINVFRRFFSRRGYPSTVYSDNGSQLVATHDVLKQQIRVLHQNAEVQQFLALSEVTWKFTVPHAPWQGGLYERLIGLVKTVLRPTIGRKLLTDTELLTLAAEVEAIRNSRPLTPLPDHPGSPLRPIDFLNPLVTVSIPLPSDSVEDNESDPDYLPPSDRNALLEQWTRSVQASNRFWNRWYHSYLDLLRERTQQNHPHPRAAHFRQPEIGELVLIWTETVPRGCWPLGTIVATKGDPGQIRSAIVRLPSGTLWERPINHLYPLELSQEPNSGRHDVHAGDPHLQAESDSGDESARTPHSTHANRNHSAAGGWHSQKVFATLLTLVALLLFAAKAGAVGQSMLCLKKHRSGVILPLPNTISCPSKLSTRAGATIVVTLFRPKYMKVPAHICTNVTRVICTKAFFALELRVTKDEVVVEGTAPELCRKLAEEKEVQVDGKTIRVFEETHGKWRSKIPTEYAYGWLGTRCYTVTNLLLEKTEVITYDGKHAILDLGNPITCAMDVGFCKGPRATAIWTVQSKMCKYERRGTYEARQQKSFVEIPKLQATFRLKQNRTMNVTECNVYFAFEAQNGFLIVERRVKRIRRGNGEDENNPKYQFLYDQLKEKFNRRADQDAIHRCHIENHLRTIVRWIAKSDATTAARILTEREDIVASVIGDKLLVYACNDSQPVRIVEKATPQENVRGLVFDAPAISHFETDKLIASLEQLRNSLNRASPSVGNTLTQRNIFDNIRDEGELIMNEIQKDLGKSAEEIAEAVEVVVTRWRFTLIAIAVVLIIVLFIAACWYCEVFRLVRKILRRRRLKAKNKSLDKKTNGPSQKGLPEDTSTHGDQNSDEIEISLTKKSVTFVPLKLPRL